ncbi:nuclear pore protein 84/107 [Camillea tinctor]|nr:nuclear pore protein 84/107 [Camillea tinctor]
MAQAVANIGFGMPTSFALSDQASETAESETTFTHDAEHFAKALDIISVAGSSPADKRAEIFRLVNVYYGYVAEKVYDLHELHRQATSARLRRLDDASSQDSMDLDDANSAGTGVPSETLQYWEQEAQVWDMLRRLLPLRYSNRSAAKPIRREISKFESCSDLWDEFLEADPIAQERKAILECLQASSDESGADIDELVREYQQRAERGDIIAYGWLHTRSAIKMQKNVNGWSGALDPNSSDAGRILVDTNGSNPLVTQLDPDVATRQNRKLQPQDEYFERAIWLGCYELLRRGRGIAEIKDWCVERTEVWRAVSMSAMPLSRDRHSESFACDPLSTLLWRRTCFALARQGGTDDYERAVYGILSGDIPSVEKVCQSWDDFVFAHYNALLRTQFDAYLMKRSSPDSTASITQTFPAFNAVQFHGDAASVGERLVSSLETNPKTSAEAKTPMKTLQAAIISNNLSQYFADLGSALGGRANDAGMTSALIPAFGDSVHTTNDTKFFQLNDHKGLRVLAHVYLLVSSLDNLQGDGYIDLEQRKAQENIISAYVSTLRLNNMMELIPLYCSKLQGDRAFFTLSRNLRGVVDRENREMLLKIMEKLGIDIAKFVVFQPHSILQQAAQTESPPAFGALSIITNDPPTLKYGRPLKPDFFGDEPEGLDSTDEQLIRSMEWFMLVEGLWDELFQVGTMIYKRFLKQFNLHAARQLSERVRCADIFRKKTGLSIDEEGGIGWFEELRNGVANGSFEVGTLTLESIVKARNYFEMECLVRVLDCMETIASSEAMAQDPTEQLGREFWTHVGDNVKSVRGFMQPILNNWLLESIEEDEDFSYLRDAYLPEVIIGYVSVLHFAGTSLSRDNLLECMELSSIIAKKDADVAAVLMKSGRMKEIVEGFANCSKALAISGNEKKPVGGSSKKLREMGWSRDLWAVKQHE